MRGHLVVLLASGVVAASGCGGSGGGDDAGPVKRSALSNAQLDVYRSEYALCRRSAFPGGIIAEIKSEYGYTGTPAEVILRMEQETYRPYLEQAAYEGCGDAYFRLPERYR